MRGEGELPAHEKHDHDDDEQKGEESWFHVASVPTTDIPRAPSL